MLTKFSLLLESKQHKRIRFFDSIWFVCEKLVCTKLCVVVVWRLDVFLPVWSCIQACQPSRRKKARLSARRQKRTYKNSPWNHPLTVQNIVLLFSCQINTLKLKYGRCLKKSKRSWLKKKAGTNLKAIPAVLKHLYTRRQLVNHSFQYITSQAAKNFVMIWNPSKVNWRGHARATTATEHDLNQGVVDKDQHCQFQMMTAPTSRRKSEDTGNRMQPYLKITDYTFMGTCDFPEKLEEEAFPQTPPIATSSSNKRGRPSEHPDDPPLLVSWETVWEPKVNSWSQAFL